MPSRILHLAVTERLLDAFDFRDPARLRIGSVVPDAELLSGDPPVKIAHCPKLLDGGRRKTLDLSGFRAKFSDRLLSDDLVFGYYLHLAGDVLHRKMFYTEIGWYPVNREAVRALHRDYRLLNPEIIARHGLNFFSAVPAPDLIAQAARDPLFDGFRMDLPGFFADMAHDFDPPETEARGEDFSVFTPALAEEWIGRTAETLIRETDALRRTGRSLLDEDAMGWERKSAVPPKTE